MGRLKNKDIGKIIAKINTIPNAAIYIFATTTCVITSLIRLLYIVYFANYNTNDTTM